jgi:hypothetical protein
MAKTGAAVHYIELQSTSASSTAKAPDSTMRRDIASIESTSLTSSRFKRRIFCNRGTSCGWMFNPPKLITADLKWSVYYGKFRRINAQTRFVDRS